MKKNSFFWVSYSDLMTSLFFIMLVLYVITFTVLQIELVDAKEKAIKLEKIEEIQKALETLDKEYFEFDSLNKRYKLSIDIQFKKNSEDIKDIPSAKRDMLVRAGKELYTQFKAVIKDNPNVDFLLVIEGNTQRLNGNEKNNPDGGYRLSYQRALALYNFWSENGINIRELAPQCEIILAGSGYFGQSRDQNDENKNKRFTIQLTSKVGKLINDFKAI
jgi:outer membrane protein OmpA-like peptidoglycan-associated protein